MTRGVLSAIILVLGACSGALLGGCGSATKTVSVTTPPAPVPSTGATTQAQETSSSTSAEADTTATQGTDGGTPAPASTRTAPEPAFAQHEGEAEGLSAASALLRSKGFTPQDTSAYHPSQTLRVLIGTRTGSTDGYGQQAFFFVNGRYIGTDSSQPSATLRVLSQADTEVTLAYPLYRKNDPLCCPSGGQATVRFQLNNGTLAPLGAIPPVTSATGLSRQ